MYGNQLLAWHLFTSKSIHDDFSLKNCYVIRFNLQDSYLLVNYEYTRFSFSVKSWVIMYSKLADSTELSGYLFIRILY